MRNHANPNTLISNSHSFLFPLENKINKSQLSGRDLLISFNRSINWHHMWKLCTKATMISSFCELKQPKNLLKNEVGRGESCWSRRTRNQRWNFQQKSRSGWYPSKMATRRIFDKTASSWLFGQALSLKKKDFHC